MDNSSQAIVELSQADLISVDELMDSPPELTLIRNSETNEDWLNNEVKRLKKICLMTISQRNGTLKLQPS